ncbi:MAG: tRNA (cytidine(34)-2'-O)-methyltransferase [Eubacteriales bacterium]|nr:tRNA (cytidine(34)-2'-O)-methyltransferase [Eubacteriales bacterium]MDY3332598.1 tRNA (cytidine(34)-2'-O)-methyltransferase [Gallibacter sp.]
MALHIVFVEPVMPENTGNIIRTCAATNTKFHLVKPLGFEFNTSKLKRAGLDYWEHADIEIHESLHDFMQSVDSDARLFLATTKGKYRYDEPEYRDGDIFVFGKETEGLPKGLIHLLYDNTIRIPMSEVTRARSFNLSNSANIILFEALRQLNFPDLK